MKMAFLCSPNNPTGNVTVEEEVRALVESTDAIVFLDEAYVEFADQSLVRPGEGVRQPGCGPHHVQGLRSGRHAPGICRGSAVDRGSVQKSCAAFLWHHLRLGGCGSGGPVGPGVHASIPWKRFAWSERGCKRRSNRIPRRPTSFTSRRMSLPM